jgi:hypothetical protein
MIFCFWYSIYHLFSSKDKIAARHVFAREASIINEGNQKKFFVADVCRFDIMKSELFDFGWI